MSTVRINWGTRIVLLYLGFVTLIVTLVYRSMNEDFDLVTQDYYGEEIRYQEVIDAGKNQAALSAPVLLQQQGKEVNFSFPPEIQGSTIKGTAQFYSSVNAQWDETFALNINDGVATVSIEGLKAVLYAVKIKWTYNNKLYYQETQMKIQP
ncbi:MAG TPA: FixH family protein [Flavipsychrobacter sp.]|nr:FixH family protein [Flavipsychrobacter sp.]